MSRRRVSLLGHPPKPWGKCAHDGQDVALYTINSQCGCRAEISNYGATIVSIWVPDRDGKFGDVVLGYDNLKAYEDHVVSMGQTVGRYANRIADGKFSLRGKEYKLLQNNGTNCLHGGQWSFDNKTWEVCETRSDMIKMFYESEDMEEGFPGHLVVSVEFSFHTCQPGGAGAALAVRYTAQTDQATVVNLTNHSYFNLLGHTGGSVHPSILDHVVTIDADRYVPVTEDCVPHGDLEPVEDGPFDFRRPRRIGEYIEAADAQLIFCNGYDHCYELNSKVPAKKVSPMTPQGMRQLGLDFDAGGRVARTRPPDAVLSEAATGRRMEMWTEEPGMQFFTDNIPDKVLALGGKGKQGVSSYTYRTGVCFESQHFPDSPNQPQFPSTMLRPGGMYRSETVYWFSVNP